MCFPFPDADNLFSEIQLNSGIRKLTSGFTKRHIIFLAHRPNAEIGAPNPVFTSLLDANPLCLVPRIGNIVDDRIDPAVNNKDPSLWRLLAGVYVFDDGLADEHHHPTSPRDVTR